jgi:DNA-binding MarR family transcriptional regulator
MTMTDEPVQDPPRTAEDDAPTLAVLERELAFLVRALEAIQRKRNYPLERAQYLLLGLLEQNGPQSVAALAERLLLDDSTVTRQVAAMEQQTLVDRVPNPGDGRSTLIRATRHGIRTAAQMRDMRTGRIALLFDDWVEPDRAALASQLAKLNVSLRKALSQPN